MTKRQKKTGGISTRSRHLPILRDEIQQILARPDGVFIDCTVGDGGHAEALLDASGLGSRLLGLDLDADSLNRTRTFLSRFGERVTLRQETYAHLAELAPAMGFTAPTGILFDLGMGTHHLGVERGFSFHNVGQLDMRFDPSGSIALPASGLSSLRRLVGQVPSYTAADVVATLHAEELTELFRLYGDEPHAERIADAIVSTRRRTPIATVPELIQTVVHALPPRARHGRTHAATRVFQALRIAVNREFETIQHGLAQAVGLLPSGGRCAVITFHSGEDRLVKQLFRDTVSTNGDLRLLHKHAIRPSWNERKQNPWSRSALLRVLERIPSRTH